MTLEGSLNEYMQYFSLIAKEINVFELIIFSAKTDKGLFEVIFKNNEGMLTIKGKDMVFARLDGKEVGAPKTIISVCKKFFNKYSKII